MRTRCLIQPHHHHELEAMMLLIRIPKFRKQQHLAIAQTANQLSLTQLSMQGSGVEVARWKIQALQHLGQNSLPSTALIAFSWQKEFHKQQNSPGRIWVWIMHSLSPAEKAIPADTGVPCPISGHTEPQGTLTVPRNRLLRTAAMQKPPQ